MTRNALTIAALTLTIACAEDADAPAETVDGVAMETAGMSAEMSATAIAAVVDPTGTRLSSGATLGAMDVVMGIGPQGCADTPNNGGSCRVDIEPEMGACPAAQPGDKGEKKGAIERIAAACGAWQAEAPSVYDIELVRSFEGFDLDPMVVTGRIFDDRSVQVEGSTDVIPSMGAVFHRAAEVVRTADAQVDISVDAGSNAIAEIATRPAGGNWTLIEVAVFYPPTEGDESQGAPVRIGPDIDETVSQRLD